MNRVKFSLIDDKERFERLSEAKRKYEEAIKKRSEFLTKAQFGNANTLKESLKNYLESNVDSNSPFLKNFDKNIDEAKNLKENISKEKFKEAGIIIPGKEGYYRQPTITRKVRDLAPDVNSLNKMIKSKNLKIVRALAPILGPAGTAITAASILSSPNPAEAAAEEGISSAIPGAGFVMGELGSSDEQKALDKKYFETLRKRSQRSK